MKINKIAKYIILTIVIVSNVMIAISSYRSNKIRLNISNNIEALTTSFEWQSASSGGYYIPIEMGTAPSKEFEEQHPNYAYKSASKYPTSTKSYSGRDFYDIGNRKWVEIPKCWIDFKDIARKSIPNGTYCYAHFDGNSCAVNCDTRGNIMED